MAWYHTQMTQAAIDWTSIDTVLLDMDGTLLDLRFDNWFWQEHVPLHYARAQGLSPEEARDLIVPKFRETRGTMQWYCIDHWSRELKLDIAALKHSVRDRVGYLPGARDFLDRLAGSGKRRVLVTNAHPVTLAIKNECVDLTRHFDACYSTHTFHAPKEQPQFWPRLHAREPFSRSRTLLVDDSLPVLEAARGFGIGYLRAVRRPDSQYPAQTTGNFTGIDRVADVFG
jgi:5'-nucleotidase